MVVSKFTTKITDRILQATAVGCSQETAAHLAGIDQATLSRWITKGDKELKAAEDEDSYSAFAKFARDYHFAQAAPKERALGIVYREMDTNPGLAWKYIERKEPGFAPPMPSMPNQPQGPVVIQLSLSNGEPVGALAAPQTIIEVGNEPNDVTGEAADAVDEDSPATVVSLAGGGGE